MKKKIITTLCYIEKDNKYLMLYRNKKENDICEGKWVGIGGKLEAGETPAQGIEREVREETGLRLTEYEQRGIIHFVSDRWDDEDIYLYTASEYEGDIDWDCREGELKWIPISEVESLPLWEGDFHFLRKLVAGERNIEMTMEYEGHKLVRVE